MKRISQETLPAFPALIPHKRCCHRRAAGRFACPCTPRCATSLREANAQSQETCVLQTFKSTSISSALQHAFGQGQLNMGSHEALPRQRYPATLIGPESFKSQAARGYHEFLLRFVASYARNSTRARRVRRPYSEHAKYRLLPAI
jgi:hypothetical protein